MHVRVLQFYIISNDCKLNANVVHHVVVWDIAKVFFRIKPTEQLRLSIQQYHNKTSNF